VGKSELEYVKRVRSQDVQLRRLQSFLAGLAEVYEKLQFEVAASLEEEEEEEEEELSFRQNIFPLSVGAPRPFTLKERSVLLALRRPSDFLDEGNLLLDPQCEVLKLCWPSAMVSADSVHFIHISVKEFMIRIPGDRQCWNSGIRNKITTSGLAGFQVVLSSQMPKDIKPRPIQRS